MRRLYDQIAKRLLRATLSSAGEVASEVELPTEARFADLVFTPDPERVAKLRDAGLLASMATELALFEAFHDPPSLLQLRECLPKQVTLHRMEIAKARERRVRGPKRPPLLWFLSAGRPGSAIQALELRPLAGWPVGTYEAAPGFG